MIVNLQKLLPWERGVQATAFTLLVVAFVLGQIAAKPDYDAMLHAQLPKLDLVRSEANTELPAVYRLAGDVSEKSDAVGVIAPGSGYGGPLVVAIHAARTEDGVTLRDVILLDHKESPAFLDRLQKKRFFEQFANMDVSSDFLIGRDIDAVSGATVSSVGFATAIRDAAHLGATQHLGLPATWQQPGWNFGTEEILLIALFAAAFGAAYYRGKYAKYYRWSIAASSLILVGFYTNSSVSLGNLASIVMGYVPPLKQHPMWWIMMIGVFGSVIVLGRNVYCQYICPFKVVQDLLSSISGIRLKIRPALQRKARLLILTMSWAGLMLIFVSTHPALGSYEPFAMMFSLEGIGIQWYILPAALMGSFFVSSFWCRLFCPVGFFLNEGVRTRRSIRDRFFPRTTKSPQ
jgi:Na+-translocating ferredoxin:NAD+ oxidoreductase RnfG subunit